MSINKISVASDHGGFCLKEYIRDYLGKISYDVIDFGTYNEDSVDYPDYAKRVVQSVLAGESDRGILICSTGIGISIAANRFSGIRAALCHDAYTARMSRLHNDANILVLGGGIVGNLLAKDIVDVWLSAKFEGGRHERRVNKMDKISLCDIKDNVE